jgi:UDP-N-acetylmuramyl pentapeptide synthase
MSCTNETVLLAKSRLAERPAFTIGVFGGFGRTAAALLIQGAISRSFKVCRGTMIPGDIAGCSQNIVEAPLDADAFIWEMKSASAADTGEFVKNFPITHAVIASAPQAPFPDFLGITESADLVSLYYNKDDEIIVPALEGIKKTGVGFTGGEIKIKEALQDIANSREPGLYVTVSIGGEDYSCYANLFGRQNARNMSFALLLALELGVSPRDIRFGMTETKLPPGVGSICRTEGGGFMIDETGGSCPYSISRSIKDIIELDVPENTAKLAILGGMRGLGAESVYWHDVVMRRACLLDGLYLIGEEWDGVVTEQTSLRGRWASADDFLRDFDRTLLNDAVTLVNDSGFYGLAKIFPADHQAEADGL